ncbi:hypothetical protein KKD37_03765 [Patescibacteria group bacterium]|nr:hypothetical protein [Patescibacteria group bacterium]
MTIKKEALSLTMKTVSIELTCPVCGRGFINLAEESVVVPQHRKKILSRRECPGSGRMLSYRPATVKDEKIIEEINGQNTK